jgi:hypothetical protein
MQCRCFARAIGSAYDRPAASKPAPRISIVPASASRRAAVVVEDIGYSLDQARNDLADGAQHNADKAKPTQPIIAALQSDLILIQTQHASYTMPSGTELVRHPIAEKSRTPARANSRPTMLGTATI